RAGSEPAALRAHARPVGARRLRARCRHAAGGRGGAVPVLHRGTTPRHGARATARRLHPRAESRRARAGGHACGARARAVREIQGRARARHACLTAPARAGGHRAQGARAHRAPGAARRVGAGRPAPGVVAGPHDLPVFVLTGPTGAGKTDWALGLAESAPVEIVSVDSALVYRGLDIGTAKPARELRERVPHHLIDICEPTET